MLYPDELRAHGSRLYHCDTDQTTHSIKLKNGRGRGIRTPDILLPKQARYQAALYPDVYCLPKTTDSQRLGGRHITR